MTAVDTTSTGSADDSSADGTAPGSGKGPRRASGLLRGWGVLAPTGRSRAVAIVLVGLLLLGGLAHLVVDRFTALPDDAVLRVGDTTVTDRDFRQRLDLMNALYGVQPPPAGPELDRFERDAAKAVAASIVLDQAAAERNLVIPDPVAQTALDKIIESKFQNNRDAFTQALGTLRVSEADVLGEVRRQLTTTRLYEDVTRGIPPVSDADLATAFEQRRADMVVPEKRHLFNIVTDSREKADGAAAQLRGGAPFAPLAASTSLDRSTAASGGDLGMLSADQLERSVADAAFTLPPGGVFGPVQTRFGWNVGQVTEIQQSQPLPLDQVREPLRAQLTDERAFERWQPWFADRIHASGIEYADRYRPAAPEALPAPMGR